MLAFGFSEARTITISSSTITLEVADANMDLTESGRFFVQVDQDDWEKNGKTMYPDKDDRSQAVKNAQSEFKRQADIYIKESIDNEFYTPRGKGSGLSFDPQGKINYNAICMNGDAGCELHVRQNNRPYILNLYPVLADENSAASAARANMITQRDIIIAAAQRGRFWK